MGADQAVLAQPAIPGRLHVLESNGHVLVRSRLDGRQRAARRAQRRVCAPGKSTRHPGQPRRVGLRPQPPVPPELLPPAAPFWIVSPEPEANAPAALAALGSGSGGLYRLGFGRPDLAPGYTLEQL